jgi:V-type H+-transporting ATPase subunit a
MSLFRSEPLELYTLLVTRESAYDILNALGQQTWIHFVDSQPDEMIMNRPFYNELKQCEEVMRKLDQLQE